MGKLTALVLGLAALGILTTALSIVVGLLYMKATSIWARWRQQKGG